MRLLENIKEEAKKDLKKILFIEYDDPRILKACSILAQEQIVKPIIVGDEAKAKKIAITHKINLTGVEFRKVSPTEPHYDSYLRKLLEIRKHKNLTETDAQKLLAEPIYYATMMVHERDADGLVSGANHPTAHTLKAAFQILKTDIIASSHTIMEVKGRSYLFADCGVNIKPNEEQLAQIAKSTIKSAEFYGIKPKVAMLSFSTKGSASDPEVDKVRNATEIVRKSMPKIIIDGEMQADAALVKEVAEIKNPNLKIKGDANILIFPDLGAANIGYKLVQRFAAAKAIGPIIQGLSKPVNDLSRGCSVEEIVYVAAITAIQAKGLEKTN